MAIWDELSAHQKGQTEGVDATEAVRLVQDVESLRPLAAGDPEMEERVSQLADEARRAARLKNVSSGPVRQGGGGDAGAGRRGAEAARRAWSRRPASSPGRRWRIWTSDCAICLRQARLTQIDAIIGKKKKLEIEVEHLRDGRYPAELFATLQLEGLMGDDEEYWPFEGEYWSDEYENYK